MFYEVLVTNAAKRPNSEQQKPIAMAEEFAHLNSASLVFFFSLYEMCFSNRTAKDRARARIVVGCCHISEVNKAFQNRKIHPATTEHTQACVKGNIFDCFLFFVEFIYGFIAHTSPTKVIAGQWLVPCEQDEYPSTRTINVTQLTYDVFERSMSTSQRSHHIQKKRIRA